MSQDEQQQCKGCEARDKIIQDLAKEIDRLNSLEKQVEAKTETKTELKKVA